MAVPMRRCLICRDSLPKAEMLRLVVDGEGQIWPDLMQKAPGRGSYHCMRTDCLRGTNSKRLQVVRSKFPQARPDWEQLRGRLQEALMMQMRTILARLAARMVVGRDAVMHRMWNNTPLLLLLAADAGEAVARQVGDAAEKRRAAGAKVASIDVPSADWLGALLGRERVAVAGVERSATTEKFERYCAWYGRLGHR